LISTSHWDHFTHLSLLLYGISQKNEKEKEKENCSVIFTFDIVFENFHKIFQTDGCLKLYHLPTNKNYVRTLYL